MRHSANHDALHGLRLLPAALLLLVACSAMAEPVKLPLESDDGKTIYVEPKVSPTESSAVTNGATLGVQKPDGTAARGGVDTSAERPTYSVGGSTGGKRSYSVDAFSDGKNNAGVKAGVTIRY